MSEVILWGAVLRFAQAGTQAAPFILIGFLVAAVFNRLLGHSGTRTLFGVGSWRSLPQAWLVGMLLPVCSLGVIPIMRQMKRAGIPGGTILAFGLTAPLFNPLSVLYGLTLSEPVTIFAFAICSLVIVTIIGIVFDRFVPLFVEAAPEPPATPYGYRRLLAVLITMARDLWSRSTLYVLLGLTGVILLSLVLPKASFQSQVNGDNILAPLLMTGVAIPAYATPMLAMSQLGMMFQHGNSVGAAFALLILGAGLNFGIIAWMLTNCGWRKAGIWLAMLLGVVLALGYGLEKPLYPTDIEAADHTHAFDVYCCPYYLSDINIFEKLTTKLADDLRVEELFALYGLSGIALIGLVIVLVDRSGSLERWLSSKAETEQGGTDRFDIIVPGWVLGAVSLLGLIAMSGAGCYAYYPDPEESLEEIFIIKGEVLSAATSGDYDHALYWLPLWEDWNRRLQVGVYLRQGTLSEYHRMKAIVVRNQLELLEHAMEDEEKEKVKKLVTKLSNSQNRLARAYRDEL